MADSEQYETIKERQRKQKRKERAKFKELASEAQLEAKRAADRERQRRRRARLKAAKLALTIQNTRSEAEAEEQGSSRPDDTSDHYGQNDNAKPSKESLMIKLDGLLGGKMPHEVVAETLNSEQSNNNHGSRFSAPSPCAQVKPLPDYSGVFSIEFTPSMSTSKRERQSSSNFPVQDQSLLSSKDLQNVGTVSTSTTHAKRTLKRNQPAIASKKHLKLKESTSSKECHINPCNLTVSGRKKSRKQSFPLKYAP